MRSSNSLMRYCDGNQILRRQTSWLHIEVVKLSCQDLPARSIVESIYLLFSEKLEYFQLNNFKPNKSPNRKVNVATHQSYSYHLQILRVKLKSSHLANTHYKL